MSDEENQDDDFTACGELTEFETTLAALRPRTSGNTLRLEATSIEPPCLNPLGHEFACIHCGIACSRHTPCAVADVALVAATCASSARRARGRISRWAWPMTSAALAAIAAGLLVMLVAHALRPAGAEKREQGAGSPAPSVAQHEDAAASAPKDVTNETNVWSRAELGDGAGYLALRNQVLRYGVDSWKSPRWPAATTGTPEEPLNYREQLKRLLQEQGFHDS
jgi:hypothetical protein